VTGTTKFGEHGLEKVETVLNEGIIVHFEYLLPVLYDVHNEVVKFDEFGFLDELPETGGRDSILDFVEDLRNEGFDVV
jgi:hypothetical protein